MLNSPIKPDTRVRWKNSSGVSPSWRGVEGVVVSSNNSSATVKITKTIKRSNKDNVYWSPIAEGSKYTTYSPEFLETISSSSADILKLYGKIYR